MEYIRKDRYSKLNRVGCQYNNYNSLLQEYYASEKDDEVSCADTFFVVTDLFSCFLYKYRRYMSIDVRGNKVTHDNILFWYSRG